MVTMRLFARKQNKARLAHRRLTTWACLFALIAQIFVPLGQVLASDTDQGIEYQLICTADGVKQILIDETGAPIEPQDVVSCAFCLMHAPPILIAPQLSAVGVVEALGEQAIFARPVHQVQTNIWRGRLHLTRAPPLSV